MKLNANKVGLALGGFAALWHAFWSGLVAMGLAQGLLDFVYSIHFLSNPFMVGNFSITTALVLVAVTFVVGYAIGYVFTLVWNKVHKGS